MKIAWVNRDLSVRSGGRRFVYSVAIQLEKLGHEVKILTSRMDREKCFLEFLRLPVEVVSRGDIHIERSLKRTILQMFYHHERHMVDEFFGQTSSSNADLPLGRKSKNDFLLEAAETLQYLMRTILAMEKTDTDGQTHRAKPEGFDLRNFR